ncbi:flagellar biosynthetic protein FliR [Neobacillus sp. PS3-40]|jgi:flagellar biosynthesis protein FliR|uniref:flagellar biosynthetic protein FliR n=1 Tax=Neobacillus sp. PS3-40 TaxID=3070679 RepID=UPI0027E135E0|nr:flagellar biosynthetic protein FliR [Neobacillus sp. PS3-40]WML43716.1 flagellar biosynthetic protein FliR [Neobacillus sp. PS3-40]
MNELLPQFPAFLLIFVRVTSFFLMMPIFSYRTIPTVHKIGFGFFLSWLIFYAIHPPLLEINGPFFFLIIKEALVGLIIGFVAYLILAAIQIAGGFIDFQLGFAIANVIDPQTGAQSPLMGQYLHTIGLLLLLSINGHHLLIDGIYNSYHFIPINQAWLPLGSKDVIEFMLRSFGSMFIIAFQMSIPVVGCLFLVDVALGIVARTVPQLNIFVVGIPVKIVVGFILIIAGLGVMMTVVSSLFETMLYTMRGMLELLGGS